MKFLYVKFLGNPEPSIRNPVNVWKNPDQTGEKMRSSIKNLNQISGLSGTHIIAVQISNVSIYIFNRSSNKTMIRVGKKGEKYKKAL